MIYIVRTKNTETPFIKIGFTKKSLSHRMKSIQTGCPYELELIFAKNGGLKEERIMHDLVVNFRAKGEWFHWNDEVKAILKLPAKIKVIDPDSPGSFLTPRQKQINALFRRGHWPTLYPHPLELFISRHIYKEEEILNFPKGKERFVLHFTTANRLSELCGGGIEDILDADPDQEKWFIMQEMVINWKKILQEGEKIWEEQKQSSSFSQPP